MILYHGTSKSCAKSIQQEGFQPPNLPKIVAAYALQYDLSPDDLMTALDDFGYFVAARGDDSRTYFTTHFKHAASYASRSPEFRWDCLWAIFNLHHPHLGQGYDSSSEGHVWVLSQMMDDPHVVLHVDVPDELLTDEIGRIHQWLDIEPTDGDDGMEVILRSPVHLPIAEVSPINFRIKFPLLTYLTGESPEEMEKQVRAGLWGEPTVYKVISHYWDWPDVRSRLPTERLRELGFETPTS